MAIQYANETGRTTIYDVYPAEYFNPSISPCREWKASGHLRDLFRITSKAYAISCSGSATLVIPEDEEPCPTSIWVTDEYDAIRGGLSRIELPIWKVSWSLDRVQGIWSWVRKALSSTVGKVEVDTDRIKVKRDLSDDVSRVWGDVHAEYVQPMSEQLRAKLATLESLWGWDTAEDLWALPDGGRCSNPQ
jgi:hypothetical protein